jgi:hypothetical protein
MELTGKVIIFESEEDAKMWFEVITETNRATAIDSLKRDMERYIEANKRMD